MLYPRMFNNKDPCYRCPWRGVRCHSSCLEYRSYATQNAERLSAHQDELRVIGYTIDRYIHLQKLTTKRKGVK